MAKPISARLQNIRSIYDTRAPIYDHETGPEGFHPRQAADYLKWVSPSEGFKILDLACGTGAISIGCAQLAGSSGAVIGVDVSTASLDIARGKAETEGLSNTKFVEGDITDLDSEWARKEGIEEGMFDAITCASAFVLLEDSAAAVKSWAKLLKTGGNLIFDVPTADSLIKGLALERVAEKMGLVNRTYTRGLIDSEAKIRALLTEAGLDDGELFVTESYADGEWIGVDDAGEVFDEMVAENKWFRGIQHELEKPGERERARRLFCEEIEEMAGGERQVKSLQRFYMAIGRKIQ